MGAPITGQQNQIVLNALLAGRELTARDAVELGIMRLAARIFELRKQGWGIKTRLVEEGQGNRYAAYKLDS